MKRSTNTSTTTLSKIPTKLPIQEKNESRNNNSLAYLQNPDPTKEVSRKSHDKVELSPEPPGEASPEAADGVSGRERLKRHRVEVAGQVWIPEMWGQEGFLKDWVDCAAFDSSLVNSSILSARDSLVEEGRRASSTRLRVPNGC